MGEKGEATNARWPVLLFVGMAAFVWFLGHAPKAHAQAFDPSGSLVDASGGDGGSARGGDAGRGGDGVLGSCSSNVNDADELGVLACASGGQGGAGGDAGESIGGNGGIAFSVGRPAPPPPPSPQLADLAVAKTAPATVTGCVFPTTCTASGTVTVTNIGSQTASSVTLVDTEQLLGLNTISFAATPSQGTCTGPAGNPVIWSCNLGDLAPGASATVTFPIDAFRGGPPGGPPQFLKNTATASTPSPEATTSNNSATTTTVLV